MEKAPGRKRTKPYESCAVRSPCSYCHRPCYHCQRGPARHQRKQVEAALRFAEEEGCRVEVLHSGPHLGRSGSAQWPAAPVWSTPRDADVAAKMIRRFVLRNQEAPS